MTMSGILSVQTGSRRPAQSTMIGEGTIHRDKAIFSPSRIYLGGEDKGDRFGILCSKGQPRAEW